MSISTKLGDDGTTQLFGSNRRVSKSDIQIELTGSLDELNVALGGVRLHCAEVLSAQEIAFFQDVQVRLMNLMGETAYDYRAGGSLRDVGMEPMAASEIDAMDAHVKAVEQRMGGFRGWAVPGTNAASLALDHARVTARRAERLMCRFADAGIHNLPVPRAWLNRMSDLLWLLARDVEQGATHSIRALRKKS